MALITMQSSILIGLPNYSNVTIGPAAVWRFVEDTDKSVDAALRNAAMLVEEIVADEQKRIKDLLNL